MTAESDITKLLKDITGVHLGANEISVLLMQMPIEFFDGGIYMRFNDFDKAGKEKPDVRIDNDPQWRSFIMNAALQIHGIKDSINVLFKSSKQRKKFVVWLYDHMMAWDNTTVKACIQGDVDRTAVMRLYKEYGYSTCPDPTFDDLADEIRIIQLTALFEEFRQDTKKTRKSRKKINKDTEIFYDDPKIRLPSLKGYESSFDFLLEPNDKKQSYLEKYMSADNLVFDNGQLKFQGKLETVSKAKLQNIITHEGVEHINVEDLIVFYSIILSKILKDKGNKARSNMPDYVTMRVGDIAKWFGIKGFTTGSFKRNKKDEDGVKYIDYIAERINQFHSIGGLIKRKIDGKEKEMRYPVLLNEGTNEVQGTVSFSSPYIRYIIAEMEKSRRVYYSENCKIKANRGKLKYKKAPNSFLAKSALFNQKNKDAVAIVHRVLVLIDQTGKGDDKVPHKKASELIKSIAGLQQRLDNSSNPNQLLRRTFNTAWKYLNDPALTYVKDKYPDIELPQPGEYPTLSTLTKVSYTFKHGDVAKNWSE